MKLYNISNKKGQGMSTSTIILLILGLIVLVALVWGFATGWNSIKNLVNPTNVDSVAQACSSACSIGSTFSYCSAQRTLRVNEAHLNVQSSCEVFSKLKQFNQYFTSYNLLCPNINCNLKCGEIYINGRNGSAYSTSGKYDLSPITGTNCYIN